MAAAAPAREPTPDDIQWSSLFNLRERPTEDQVSIVDYGYDHKSSSIGKRKLYDLLADLYPGFVLYRFALSDETEADLKSGDSKNHFCTHPSFCFQASYINYTDRDMEQFNTKPPNGPHKFWKITLPTGCKRVSSSPGWQRCGLFHFTGSEDMEIMKRKLVDPTVKLRPSTDAFSRDYFIRPNPHGSGFAVDASDHFVGRLPADAVVQAFDIPEACFDLQYGMMEAWGTPSNGYPTQTVHFNWKYAINRARKRGVLPREFETNEVLALKEAQWIASYLFDEDCADNDIPKYFDGGVPATFLPQWDTDPDRDAQFLDGPPLDSAHGYYTDDFCRKLVLACPALQFTDKFGTVFKELSKDAPIPYRQKPRVYCKMAVEFETAMRQATVYNMYDRYSRQPALCDFDTIYTPFVQIINEGAHDVPGFATLIALYQLQELDSDLTALIEGSSLSLETSKEIEKETACKILEGVLRDPEKHFVTDVRNRESFRLFDHSSFDHCDEGLRRAVYEVAPTKPILELNDDITISWGISQKLRTVSMSNEGLALLLGLDLDAEGLIGGIDRLIRKLTAGTLSEADITAFFELIVTMPVAEARMTAVPLINVLQVRPSTFKSECDRLDEAFDDAIEEADKDDDRSKISELQEQYMNARYDAEDEFLVVTIVERLIERGAAAGPRASFCQIII